MRLSAIAEGLFGKTKIPARSPEVKRSNHWVSGGVFAQFSRPAHGKWHAGFNFAWSPGLDEYMRLDMQRDLQRIHGLYKPGMVEERPLRDGSDEKLVGVSREDGRDEHGRNRHMILYTRVPLGADTGRVAQHLLTLHPREFGPEPRLSPAQAGPAQADPAQAGEAHPSPPRATREPTATPRAAYMPCPQCGRPTPPGLNHKRRCIICDIEFGDANRTG